MKPGKVLQTSKIQTKMCRVFRFTFILCLNYVTKTFLCLQVICSEGSKHLLCLWRQKKREKHIHVRVTKNLVGFITISPLLIDYAFMICFILCGSTEDVNSCKKTCSMALTEITILSNIFASYAAIKIVGLQQDSILSPLHQCCSALPTELRKPVHWEQSNLLSLS